MPEEKMTTVTEEVPIKLSPEEVAERALMLVTIIEKRNDVDEARREIAGDYKQKLKELDDEIGIRLKAIREKAETREMECQAKPNVKKGIVELYDPTTGKRIHARAMTDADRQMSL